MKTITNNEIASILEVALLINSKTKIPDLNSPEVVRLEPRWHGQPVQVVKEYKDFDALRIPYLCMHYGTRGEGVNVVVIDSGIEASHPVFAHHPRIIEKSCLPSVNSPLDGLGHGTWVAGKIAGQGIGIAPKCNLWSLRVFDESGTGLSSFTSDALNWVLKNVPPPMIINLSLGSREPHQPTLQVLKKLKAIGAIIFAAMGNYHTDKPFYPAAFMDETIAVGAVDDANVLTTFSNWGANVDVVTFGKECYSAYIGGTYREMSGTSMATPIVAGIGALGLSFLNTKLDYLPPTEKCAIIETALKQSAIDIGPAGRDSYYGFGAINGERFMDLLDKRVTGSSV